MSTATYRCGCARVTADRDSAHRLDRAIDVHCHILVPEAEALVVQRPEYATLAEQQIRLNGAASQAHNASLMPGYMRRLLEVETRLEDMDALGVAIQALSPSPTQYHYWAEPELAMSLVTCQNERLHSICVQYPDRFVAFAAVALQHPELAAAQLRGAMSAGFKGAEISTRIGTVDLSDTSFAPFWTAAEETGAAIFIHPIGSSLGERLNDSYLSNIIGQPIETTIALSKMIFAGVFDRHPKLKIIAAHGGGYLPHYFGRSDHAYQVRPESRGCAQRPSDYLRQIWFDTVVHDPLILQHLIDVVGASQVVIGTDYPFDMGEYRLTELLDDVARLSPADRAAIGSGNARHVLGLPDAPATA